jgi:hypothetical protein
MTPIDYQSTLERFENAAITRAKKRLAKGGKKTSTVDTSELDCIYHAPYIAVQREDKTWAVHMGCCNHWDCPRCGIIRAKSEYWRIVQGSETIVQQGHELWFLTITTRGAGLSVAEAESNYLQWTNRLLSNLRAQSQRKPTYWCYVQVTERQNRMHPHSHILTTWYPTDIFDSEGQLFEGVKLQYETKNGQKQAYYSSAIRSDSLQAAVCSSGLGEQYDLSKVRSISAVSRYVGKYLFKHSLSTTWPAGWKRVRYSHSWPKSEQQKASDGFAILTREDWFKLASLTDTVTCYDHLTAKNTSEYLWAYGTKVRDKTSTKD